MECWHGNEIFSGRSAGVKAGNRERRLVVPKLKEDESKAKGLLHKTLSWGEDDNVNEAENIQEKVL